MYTVKKCSTPPNLAAEWNSLDWQQAETLEIMTPPQDCEYEHKPRTQCRLLHDGGNIYGLFQVEDRYVYCVTTRLNDQVCRDSCVEIFIEPPGGNGYFNFEFSGNGNMLLYHIRNAERGDNGFKDYNKSTPEDVAGMEIFHTLPKIVNPEITEPTTWRLGFKIPLSLFAGMLGSTPPLSGSVWRGNLYKCGSSTSQPHLYTWQPIVIRNFHQPDLFGEITFE